MYVCLLLITLAVTSLVQSYQMDIMKITNVEFPYHGGYVATASSPLNTELPAFTVCYRMLIDSYNYEMFAPFGADLDGKGYNWYMLDRMCWKCGIGSEGHQGGMLYLVRNIPGGGLVNRQFPRYHV